MSGVEGPIELQLMRLGGAGGYQFQPITLGDWCEAIDARAGIRLCEAGAATPNARTGEVLTLWVGDKDRADAEVELPDGTWRPTFRWHNSGYAVVPLSFDATDSAAPQTRALFALAETLEAVVVDGRGTRWEAP